VAEGLVLGDADVLQEELLIVVEPGQERLRALDSPALLRELDRSLLVGHPAAAVARLCLLYVAAARLLHCLRQLLLQRLPQKACEAHVARLQQLHLVALHEVGLLAGSLQLDALLGEGAVGA